jgi:hypothetical protein
MACCAVLCCVLHRLAQQEVELGSLQLEVKQGHQDLTRKVSDSCNTFGSRPVLLQQTPAHNHANLRTLLH